MQLGANPNDISINIIFTEFISNTTFIKIIINNYKDIKQYEKDNDISIA